MNKNLFRYSLFIVFGLILLLSLFLGHDHVKLALQSNIANSQTLRKLVDNGLLKDPLVEAVEKTLASQVYSIDQYGRLWSSDSRTWIGENSPSHGSCYTVKDRFKQYANLKPADIARISSYSHKSDVVFLYRLSSYDFESDHLSTDEFWLHLRAMVLELVWKKMLDFRLLIHLDFPEHQWNNWIATHIPPEYHPLVEIVTSEMAGLASNVTFSASFYNHNMTYWYADTHPEYSFFWTAEYDVRVIGRWDLFLNQVDQIAVNCGDVEPYKFDFVVFDVPTEPDPSFLTGNCNIEARFWRMQSSMLNGWSRNLVDSMKSYLQKSQNCYIDIFPSTVAYAENLTTLFASTPVYFSATDITFGNVTLSRHWEYFTISSMKKGPNDISCIDWGFHGSTFSYPDMFDFASRSAIMWYEDWIDNPIICRPLSLVHPVKKKWSAAPLSEIL